MLTRRRAANWRDPSSSYLGAPLRDHWLIVGVPVGYIDIMDGSVAVGSWMCACERSFAIRSMDRPGRWSFSGAWECGVSVYVWVEIAASSLTLTLLALCNNFLVLYLVSFLSFIST